MPIYSGASCAHRDLGFEFPLIDFGADPNVTAIQIIKILENCRFDRKEIHRCRKQVLRHHNFMYWLPHLLESHIG